MRKRLGVVIGLTLASGVAFAGPPAGTIGVGVAHTESTFDNGNTIFVPYTLGNGLWVEPFISYANQDVDGGDETTSLNIGAGLFKNFHETAKTHAYFGGRLGYSYFDSDQNGDDSGVLVQPTLGFGYSPVEDITFGAEAFVTYQDSDIDGIESYGTGTSLFARYYFTQ